MLHYMTPPIKVFISYTHDSPDHDSRVLSLSNALRQLGFDSDLDQYHINERWPHWMEERIDWADFVVIVCTETYLRRWKLEETPGIGLGAQWESLLARQLLYESPRRNDKFVPVIFSSTDQQFIPNCRFKPGETVDRPFIYEIVRRRPVALFKTLPNQFDPIVNPYSLFPFKLCLYYLFRVIDGKQVG